MADLYRFYPQLILRTPARPFVLVLDEDDLPAVLTDALFMEALYLASPVLYGECVKWQAGQITNARKIVNLRRALTRYQARMYSRCTPFGLFAGCTLISWGTNSRVQLAAGSNRRYTRLDMHYLCALAQHLAAREDIQPWLLYTPNTSLYRLGDAVRYVEHHYVDGAPVHQLSAVEASAPLLQLLAATQQPQTLPELASMLRGPGVTRESARAFVEELISAQVLVSELEPTVTGQEFFYHLRAVVARVLTRAPTPDLLATAHLLDAVQQQLADLDDGRVNAAGAYERLAAMLVPLGVPTEAGKLFQTDVVTGVEAAVPHTWDQALQRTLGEALEAVAYLTPSPGNQRLVDFARRFHARYEDREVPLLEALDTESGLAYGSWESNAYSALVHDLVLPESIEASPRLQSSGSQHYLERRLRDAAHNRQYEVKITRSDLSGLGFRAGAALPLPSVGLLFRWVSTDQILLEGVTGSGAANLLGRFAHADPAIAHLIQEITHHEQQRNPDVAFAEICHLPAARIGNLLQRPHFRALEIPYLAQSTLPQAQQVRVQDLFIAVRNGQFVLRSSPLNRVIVPRLSTAHNFAGDALPVYQFLCDVQTQGLQSHLGPVWPTIGSRPQFMPRLTYETVILEAASWQLDAMDLQPLLQSPAAEFATRFQAFRTHWQLPQLFVLADGDNELLVDADNQALVDAWLAGIRHRSVVVLKEFLFDPATSPVRDVEGRPYVPQLLAVLESQNPNYFRSTVDPPKLFADPPREFFPGSEWLYYKLYCGTQVANQVLLEVIQPLVAHLLSQDLISSWFFVRYADPDPHLRVRWHLTSTGHLGKVIHLVGEGLQPHCANGTVWKVQLDTYRRELERYGTRTMGLSEDLFCYQSAGVLAYLAGEATADQPAEPWPWGLAAVDTLLEAFALTLDQKITLLREAKEDFAREFGGDQPLKQQLDAKYRTQRAMIELAMGQAGIPAPPALLRITEQIQLLANSQPLDVSINQLLRSYLHMLFNRLLPANARLHELVLYDFLFRYYQSRRKRSPA